MYTIKTFNKIKNLMGEGFTLDENAKDYDAIMVRSADLKEETFSKNCRAIARVRDRHRRGGKMYGTWNCSI